MSAGKRIALSFAVAAVVLLVNALLMARGAPLVVRFIAAAAIGVAYALGLLAWQARQARR